MPVDLADADLEGSEPMGIPQPHQSFSFIFGRDVATHAGPVSGNGGLLASQEFVNRFLFDLAVKIPECCVDACQGPADKGPGKLVVGLDAPIHDGIDVGRIFPNYLAGQMSMQDGGGDIWLKGRDLPGPLLPIIGGDADHAHWTSGEGLDFLDGPAWLDDTVFHVSVHPPQILVGAT